MSRGERNCRGWTRALILALFALASAACGGGGGGGTTPPPPTNRAPTADAGADQLATVGAQVTLAGSATDPDGDAVNFSWAFASRPDGSQAALSGAATASPRFTPDVGGRYALTLTASDGRLQSTDQVNVDANTRPEAVAGPDQAVDAGSTVILDGRGSVDADGDALTFQWVLSRPVGSQAVLSDPASTMPSFVADVPGSYAVTLVVNDGQLDSAADTTLITANAVAVNTPPVADAGPDQDVIVGTPVQLDGRGSSDADGDELGYSWTLTAPVGSAAVLTDATTPSPSFNVDVVGTYAATLIVNDGQVNSAPDMVTIVVSAVGANRAPMADAGINQSLQTGAVVQLDGSGSSDPDGDPLLYAWQLTRPEGSAAALSDPVSISPTFTADVAGTYTAALRVSDDKAASSQDGVEIVASDPGVNSPPVADAGSPQTVDVGQPVTLDGGDSADAEGDPLTYLWILSAPAGSAAVLSDAGTRTPSFTPDAAGTYTATLTVSDGQSDSAPDSVAITVRTPQTNTPPLADAGPDQSRHIGEMIPLDGSASSDPDGDALSYRWSLSTPAGSASALSDTTRVSPDFTADVAGTYTATLIVSDGTTDSAPDSATVVVTEPQTNTRPVAHAGPDRQAETAVTVILDGRTSADADGDPLTYAWVLSRPETSQSVLSDPTSPLPNFTPDVAGTFLAELVVNDGQLDSAPDTVIIRVDEAPVIGPPGNSPPVADAGPDQSAEAGQPVSLDGRASTDPDGDPITYSWSLGRPVGSQAGLTGAATSTPQFTPDIAGTYAATLVVSDGNATSVADTSLVTVSPANRPPVANAGPDQNGQVGASVSLDGTGSRDDDGDPLTYAWTLARPPGSAAALSNPGAVAPSFTADVAGTYTATLVVNDATETSAPDTAVVVISAVNSRPVARAGSDSTAAIGSTVQLDGSTSSDADGDPLTYAWSLSRPDGSQAQLSGAATATPTFAIDVAGVYAATLIVNDGIVNSAPDSVAVTAINGRPTASAGMDQAVNTGATVALDGTASSDPDNQPLSYRWTLSRPDGSVAQLAGGATATPVFVADVAGLFTATLVVADGTEDSLPDSVNITVNARPDASAGPDQDVTVGTLVQLDGTASGDSDGDSLSFSWALVRPEGSQAALSDPSSATPSFAADIGGTYTATLTVSDGKAQDVDAVRVTANTRPVAEAGPPQAVDVDATVTLDGSGSADADGDPLTYAWTLQRPAGSGASLSDATAVNPVFVPDLEGSYKATLVVNDGRTDSTPDTVTVTATVPDVDISGRVTFDRVPHAANGGLDYGGTVQAPARGVTVEAVGSGGAVIAATRTDSGGNYRLTVPPETAVTLRVKAEMVRGGAPGWDFRVLDNTSGGALYSLLGTSFDSGSTDLTVDLNAASGWDPAAQAYTAIRAAAPFAILDTAYDGLALLLEADPDGVFPPLTLNWSPLNRPSADFDPVVGDIVSTAYVVGFGVRGMFILGSENEDTDEYDPHVIAHEFGHYIEDRLARTDSTGGAHTITARLDPRLAFSEGWSNAFSAMAVGSPLYKDSRGAAQASGFMFNIETNSVTNPGWYNESSIHSVLYDIYDDASDGLDATAAGFGPIYQGMTGWHAQTEALTSIFSLIPELKARLPADAANINQLLGGQSVVGNTMDIWGSTETNDAGRGTDVLPVYTDLAVGAANPVTVCTINAFGDFNRLSNRRFVRFDVPSQGNYRIRVTGPSDSDPDLAVFRQGLEALSEGLLAGQEQLFLPLDVGTRVLEVYDACMVFGASANPSVCPNNPPTQTCLDVTVELQ